MVKELNTAGFTPLRTEALTPRGNRRTKKVHANVPDGHRTISPGVYRKVLKAIQEAKA